MLENGQPKSQSAIHALRSGSYAGSNDHGVKQVAGGGDRVIQERERPTGTNRSTNQTGMKLYNERLVLSLVRTHGPLSKGEVSKLTGLSAQASSVIMKQLEVDGLLLKQDPQRGKVGQPSVPMSLNPEGAFSIGFKIGRRSADLALMDMVGTMRLIIRTTYAYPAPSQLLNFFSSGVETLLDGMTRGQIFRIRGVGIAAPSEMWSWEEEVGAPHDVFEAWKTFNIKAEVEKLVSWPVHSYNDATAACAAELAFGEGRKYPDFLYVFFATLVGGGVVLDGSLYSGRRGYAGSIGSAPVPSSEPGQPAQRLIRCASIYLLERMVRESGGDPMTMLLQRQDDWSHLGRILDAWLEHTSESLAYAVASAISVIDFYNVVVDGGFPAHVREEVVRRTREKYAALDMQGVASVDITAGRMGSDARVLGAASLPLLADYARDRDVLFT